MKILLSIFCFVCFTNLLYANNYYCHESDTCFEKAKAYEQKEDKANALKFYLQGCKKFNDMHAGNSCVGVADIVYDQGNMKEAWIFIKRACEFEIALGCDKAAYLANLKDIKKAQGWNDKVSVVMLRYSFFAKQYYERDCKKGDKKACIRAKDFKSLDMMDEDSMDYLLLSAKSVISDDSLSRIQVAIENKDDKAFEREMELVGKKHKKLEQVLRKMQGESH